MNIHQQFVQLGKIRKDSEYKLEEMLPKIYKSEIYKKYAADIYQYAMMFAGISPGVVDKVLRITRKHYDKPALMETIGEVGIHKVALVVGIATPENEKELAQSVKTMSKSGIQQMAQDARREKKIEMFGEIEEVVKIELDKEMQFLFNKLKKQFGLSSKETLRKILQTYTTTQNPEKLKSVPGNSSTKIAEEKQKSSDPRPPTRYIPAQTKREAITKTNGKCAYPNCTKPYDIIHHRDRFAASKSHESITPLCHQHHEIAHNGLIENENQPPENWKIRLNRQLDQIDQLFLKYKHIQR